MIYEYACITCNNTFDIVKCADKSGWQEPCPKCGKLADKRFTFRGQTQIENWAPGYYYAFGKNFRNKGELKNEIRRLNGEEGRVIIEAGNEKPRLKPQRKEYRLPWQS